MNGKPGGLVVQMHNRPVFSGSRTDISSRRTLCSLNLHANSWDNPTLSRGCLPCTDKGIQKLLVKKALQIHVCSPMPNFSVDQKHGE